MASLRAAESTIVPRSNGRSRAHAPPPPAPPLPPPPALLTIVPIAQPAALDDAPGARIGSPHAQPTAANDASHPANSAVLCSPPATGLPPRQQQVLEMFARGMSQKVIAYDLGIAGSTAATHLRKALDRLCIRRPQVPYAVAVASGDAQMPDDAADVPLPAGLSPAEAEVVRAVLRGASNRQIARDRDRSARTVANQIAAAFRKLGVGSRGELYARAASWRIGSVGLGA
jgi:DNA-binding NarL/FixJ family response regulator